ncbi:cell division cycle 7-related protein kinase-like [Physella acuta]|uniref:cell division cycle 7-related protein kinase-like n=1 Tax=Physella acuta TaxID=109671 RepID=UPI0027DBC81D|nr:cell division cycle 7-related protein kinase-like [Physella acuta]
MSIGLLCHLPNVHMFQGGSKYKTVDDMDNDSSLTEDLKKETEKENESCTVGLEIDDESTKIIDKIENDVEVKDDLIKLVPSNFKSPSFMNDEDAEISALYNAIPEVANHFTITCKIGEGAFSCVYLAKLKHYPEVNEMFALKHIIPTTHPSRIQNELTCLLKIGGCDNVMGVKLCLRNRDHVVFVMPVFLHDKFQECLHTMSVDEAREYMRNLLIALKRVHEFNVIHRDIKPSNFLYNRQQKRFSLVDFGLASGPMLIDRDLEKHSRAGLTTHKQTLPNQMPDVRVPLSPSKFSLNLPHIPPAHSTKGKVLHHKAGMKTIRLSNPSTTAASWLADSQGCDCFGRPQICSICVARPNQVAPRAGTAGFRAPEVLMKCTEQNTGVDIWSAGVILLSILSARYPFFRAQDDMGYLAQIISVLGSASMVKAAKAIGKNLLVSEHLEPIDLKTACTKLRLSQMSFKLGPASQNNTVLQSWQEVSDDPFDLLSKMLDPNPYTRITAAEALNHPFFQNGPPS